MLRSGGGSENRLGRLWLPGHSIKVRTRACCKRLKCPAVCSSPVLVATDSTHTCCSQGIAALGEDATTGLEADASLLIPDMAGIWEWEWLLHSRDISWRLHLAVQAELEQETIKQSITKKLASVALTRMMKCYSPLRL